jgi:hypothetical protein
MNLSQADIQIRTMTFTEGEVLILTHPANLPIQEQRVLWEFAADVANRQGGVKPIVLVIPDNLTLEKLSDEELERAGLMRIPEE